MRQFFFFTICLCLASILFGGCRTKYIPVETVRMDSIYLSKEYRDSIYLRDSVFVREKGDTVYQYKYKYIYKEIFKTDTVHTERTDTIAKVVEVEKNLTRWQSFKMEFGGIVFGVCMGLILVITYLLWRKKVH